MKSEFDAREWTEVMRLLHKFVSASKFIGSPQELQMDSAFDLIEAWDPKAERREIPFSSVEGGSGDVLERFLPRNAIVGARALVVPDVGCGWPEYFPYVCKDTSLIDRMNEERNRESLPGWGDTLIVFESGWIIFFDHENGVTVAEPPNWCAEQNVDLNA